MRTTPPPSVWGCARASEAKRAALLSLALPALLLLLPDAAPAGSPRAARASRSKEVSTADSSRAGAGADSLPLAFGNPVTLARNLTGPGRVVEPSGVSVDVFGRVYVSDAALHRLQRYDARGEWLGESGGLGSDPGQMRHPGAVTTLGTLSVAVLDEENHRVLSYDLFGRLQTTLISFDDLEGELGRLDPADLAADRGGAVYVADAERERLLVFDFSGRYLRTLGGLGTQPGAFRGLAGVGVSRRAEIVTAERANARVQRLDAGGRVLGAWPIPATGSWGRLPVAVDDSGRVAVADEASGNLWVFDSGGRLLASLRGLEGPRSLAFARDGTLLVAEAAGGRVRRFSLEGNPRGGAARGE